MTREVIIIGAGPAGLGAAIELARSGVGVTIIDEGPAPGGQVYRAAEKVAKGASRLEEWLGADYAAGKALIAEVRDNPLITLLNDTSVWNIDCREDGIRLGLLENGVARVAVAANVVAATGAMERPTPFPGWLLPGVMSIGAAQTLLKDSALVPGDDAVIAGSGPLLYLFAHQLLSAGVKPRAVLDTGDKWIARANWSALLAAVWRNTGQLIKGLGWRNHIVESGVPHVYGVDGLEAIGSEKVEGVRYRANGAWNELPTGLLLVHDGVVPNTHLTMAARCAHDWLPGQRYWRPRLTDAGETSQPGLWIAGDGGGIVGAEAARLQGRMLGRRLAAGLGRKRMVTGDQQDRRALARVLRLRRFLDAQYQPASPFLRVGDDVAICRCEAITAGEIRALAGIGCTGPNQARAFTRAGMGACMGRQCGMMVSTLLAEASGTPVAEVGHYSVRAPVKPISIAQLAGLTETEPTSPE